ncbi:MAG: S8 family serine peptidase [Kofleriaceae bacterium]
MRAPNSSRFRGARRPGLWFAIATVVVVVPLNGCVVGDTVPENVYLVTASQPTATAEITKTVLANGGVPLEVFDEFGIVQAALEPETATEAAGWDGVAAVERDLGFTPNAIAQHVHPASELQTEPWGVRVVGGPVVPRHALWVLDSGVDLDHADLNIDRQRSYDVIALRDPDDAADVAHGTAVAGVAAAIDNDDGVVGVAPGALVASVRVLDSSRRGATSDLLAGLAHVYANATVGDVANISLTAPGHSAAITVAVAALVSRGISVVVAAGNSGSNVENYSPASIDMVGVWTIGASTKDDCIASFSNRGSGLDLLAPGVDIVTLAPGGGLAVFEGTSLAAPHVAGLMLGDALMSRALTCGGASSLHAAIAR